MTDKIRASTSTDYCIFCNKLVDHQKDEYSVTKRKTTNWFHKKCFEIYEPITGKDWTE